MTLLVLLSTKWNKKFGKNPCNIKLRVRYALLMENIGEEYTLMKLSSWTQKLCRTESKLVNIKSPLTKHVVVVQYWQFISSRGKHSNSSNIQNAALNSIFSWIIYKVMSA